MEITERGQLLIQDLYAKTAPVYDNNPLEFYTWVIYYMDILLADYNEYYKIPGGLGASVNAGRGASKNLFCAGPGKG